MGSRILSPLAVALIVLAGVYPAAGQDPAPSAPPKTQPQPPTSSQTTPASAPAAATDVDKLPISLDRIREQLAHEPALSRNLLHALDIPVFRTETKTDFVYRPNPNDWKDDTGGSDSKPPINRWAYDYQKMVNPNSNPGSGFVVLPAITSIFTRIRHSMQ